MNSRHHEEMKQSPALKRVNIHEITEKFQSKKEVYNFLSQNCEAYLPKVDTINIYFLKQILRGQKDVRSLHVTFIVYQEVTSESVSGASDRGAHD